MQSRRRSRSAEPAARPVRRPSRVLLPRRPRVDVQGDLLAQESGREYERGTRDAAAAVGADLVTAERSPSEKPATELIWRTQEAVVVQQLGGRCVERAWNVAGVRPTDDTVVTVVRSRVEQGAVARDIGYLVAVQHCDPWAVVRGFAPRARFGAGAPIDSWWDAPSVPPALTQAGRAPSSTDVGTPAQARVNHARVADVKSARRREKTTIRRRPESDQSDARERSPSRSGRGR